MMDQLAFLRERIPAYADYGDEEARHLVDRQVRAYVGEALSGLRERVWSALSESLAQQLERMLMLCEFTNQQLMHILDHARLADAEFEELHAVDHQLITTADRAVSIEVAMLDAYLEELTSLFARRAQAVSWVEGRR
jgi:tetraacyldisaccharide-1-P 4'-kinase